MTAFARLPSIGRHHATFGIKHRPLAAKCTTIYPQIYSFSSQELDINSHHVAQSHSSGELSSGAKHVGFLKTGEWSGLGGPKALQQHMIHRVEMPLNPSSLETMTVPRSIRSRVVQRLPANSAEHVHNNVSRRGRRSWMLPLARAILNRQLAARLAAYNANTDLEHLRAQKASLPANSYRKQVLDLVNGSQFCIVTGATGSGKTTQVPQMILEDAIEQGRGADTCILCLQPRRIAATWVAQRVALERGERLGESVGFQVRFQACPAKLEGGTVEFHTVGVFLRKFEDGDRTILDRYSHIVIDEVHERSIDLDLLLVVLKRAIAERLAKGKNVPKIVLMSASVGDPKQFQEYFADSLPDSNGPRLPAHKTCPLLSIPGRTFPVSAIYLNDLLPIIRDKYGEQLDLLLENKPHKDEFVKYLDTETSSKWDMINMTLKEQHAAFVPIDLVAATIAYIASSGSPGAILVFLPGLKEIAAVSYLLRDKLGFLGLDFNDTSKFRIHSLHSNVPIAVQNEIFEEIPIGCRRIILSSNIAETSVTVPDVVHVIDVGKTRGHNYDPTTRVTTQITGWQTKSKAIQREGRAGRTQEGHYYGLYSYSRRLSMETTEMPTILRSDLTNTCLSVKALDFRGNAADFFDASITPPSPVAVEEAINNLKAMDALADNETITSLGLLLRRIPLHPSLGKMILLGLFFRCLGPMIVLCALPTNASLLEVPLDKRYAAGQAHKKFLVSGSDHLAQINAFKSLRQMERIGYCEAVKFARTNYLNFSVYQETKLVMGQIEKVLFGQGLIPAIPKVERRFSNAGGIQLNINSGNEKLLKALLVKGLYPNVAVKQASNNNRTVVRTPTSGSDFVFLHSSSVNSPNASGDTFRKHSTFVYSQMISQSHIDYMFLSRVSHIDSPLVMALFGGPLLRPEPHDTVVQQQPLPATNGEKFAFSYEVEGSGNNNPQFRTPAETLVQFREHMDAVLNDAFRRLLYQQRGTHFAARTPRTGPPWAGTPELEDLVDRLVRLLNLEYAPFR